MRLAVVASNPVQYQAPLFRELAQQTELTVFFAHRATSDDQAEAGFGINFDWDISLLAGFNHVFLRNEASKPGLSRFAGCDTPEIGTRLRKGSYDAMLVMGWHRKCFV